ncbi:MAG: lamin tail domain-containing protein [Chitinophagales bacterium]|nr:lamin tail domain-containing protein [Chitinophagales bacterium]
MRLYCLVCLLFMLIPIKPINAQVVINEVMHKPGPSVAPPNPTINQGVRRKEYVEIFNKNCFAVDISCWLIGSHVPAVVGGNYDGAFQFPSGTVIQPGQHMVVGGTQSQNNSSYPASYLTFDVNSYVGTPNLSDPNTNWLFPNGDGWVALYDNNGDVVDAIYWSFSSSAPDLNTDSDFGSKPTKPTACTIAAATLASARQIKANTPTKITYVGEATNFDMTFSRLPDGGTWTRNVAPSINPAAPTGRCNNGQCATIPVITFNATTVQPTCGNNNGSITLNVTSSGNATFVWVPNPPATNTVSSTSASNLGANSYKITVSQNGCSKDTTIVLLPSSSQTPTINITASANPICLGTNVTFNAVNTNGGTAPIYQWKKNGANVGTNSSSFSTTALNNGDIITCVLTSNAPCVSPITATSNTIIMVVNTPANAGIDGTTSICDNSSTAINLASLITGEQPGGVWTRLTGTGGTFLAASGTFTPTPGAITSTFQYSIIGTAPCANDVSVATVNISAQPNAGTDGNISTCDNSGIAISLASLITGEQSGGVWTRLTGTGGTFVAATGAFTPTPGTTTSTFQYSVAGTAPCVSDVSIATVTISGSLPASVNITASSNPICSGTSITFTANPTNGGVPTYQWKLNGNNVGTNSSTYTNNSPNNGDIVTCVMISNLGCVTGSPTTSNQIAITVNTPASAGNDGGMSVCEDNSTVINLATIITGEQNGGTWIRLTGTGGIFNATSGTFTPVIGATTSTFQYTVTGIAPCVNDISIATINIFSKPDAGTDGSTTICGASTTPVNLYNLITGEQNGGVWIRLTGTGGIFDAANGVFTPTAGVTNSTFQYSISGTAPCANDLSIATVNFSAAQLASVAILADKNTICTGGTVSFTAVPTNGGVLPTFQWKLNGINVGLNQSTYTSSTLQNGDMITCVMTSNLACVSGSPVTSNQVTITVTTPVIPTISIVADNNPICAGQSVNFVANTANQGTTPVYQWKLNGVNVGSNNANYSSTSLVNGDIVSCVLTSSLGCVTSASVTSNNINIQVTSVVIPTISITASNNPICAGTNIVFTAVGNGGGNNPVYQWQLNGNNVGTNSTVFTSSTINNGDQISCTFTSSSSCANPNSTTSNVIMITVNPIVVPVISIVLNNNSICSGTPITATATISGGGSSPTYQWSVNGIGVGNNSATYSSNSFVNGDKIKCELTSGATCATPSSVISNELIVVVNDIVIPTISINASNTNSCSGQNISFSSTITNGGNLPLYQWRLNGIDILGATSSTYMSNTLSNGDNISCVLTSSASCANPVIVTSNPVVVNIQPVVMPTITIATPNNPLCSGETAQFTSLIANGGSNPIYQWKVNGVNIGINSATFSSSALTDNSQITCLLTSNANCANPVSATSNTIIMDVVNSNIPVQLGKDTLLCVGDTLTLSITGNYQVTWSNGSHDNTINITTPGLYSVLLESSGCAFGRDEIDVDFEDCSCHVEFPTAFSPNNDRLNDFFLQVSNCPGLTDYFLQVYNRWGQLVFETNNPTTGWDGIFNTLNQPVDNYIYRFSANIEGRQESGSGMFMLIR